MNYGIHLTAELPTCIKSATSFHCLSFRAVRMIRAYTAPIVFVTTVHTHLRKVRVRTEVKERDRNRGVRERGKGREREEGERGKKRKWEGN